MTTTASKNLQNKYYIWKKSDLSNMERKRFMLHEQHQRVLFCLLKMNWNWKANLKTV